MPDDASPGFFSSLMGGIGGLLGFKNDPAQPQRPDAQQTDEPSEDYAARRQNTRFAMMKQEVDGLLQKYPATEDLPKEAISADLRELRRKGFDQKEEDAIVNTFAHAYGARRGALEGALGRPGGEEWQSQNAPSKGGAPNYAAGEPGPSAGSPDFSDQVMSKLYENWRKSGRGGGTWIQKDKRGRPQVITGPNTGFET